MVFASLQATGVVRAEVISKAKCILWDELWCATYGQGSTRMAPMSQGLIGP